jgi:hypothetical protein
MIDIDIDLTEQRVFRNYEDNKHKQNIMKTSNRFKKYKNIFNKEFGYEEYYYDRYYNIQNDNPFINKDYNIDNIIKNYNINNIYDYMLIVNQLETEGKITLDKHYSLMEGIFRNDYICEYCNIFLDNIEIGKKQRLLSLCNDCTQKYLFNDIIPKFQKVSYEEELNNFINISI